MAMVYEFIESFDHYTWAQAAEKYSNVVGTGIMQSGTAKHGMAFQSNNSGGLIRDGLTPSASYTIGFWFRTTSLANVFIFRFRQGGSAQIQIELSTGGSGTLSASRVGALIGTSAVGVIAINTWYWLEFKVYCDNTAGFVEIRINGVAVYTGSSKDTTTTATQNIDGFEFPANNAFYDSVVVMRGVSPTENDQTTYPPGYMRVDAYYANATGSSSQFTNSSGTSVNNYAFINDPQPNDDTTYVEGSSSGTTDLYRYGSLISSNNILAVQANPISKRTDAGPRQIISVARISGTIYAGTYTGTLTTAYYDYTTIWNYDPNSTGGTGVWSPPAFNNAEFGPRMII